MTKGEVGAEHDVCCTAGAHNPDSGAMIVVEVDLIFLGECVGDFFDPVDDKFVFWLDNAEENFAKACDATAVAAWVAAENLEVVAADVDEFGCPVAPELEGVGDASLTNDSNTVYTTWNILFHIFNI